jgi:hypothetical protein
VYLQFLHAYPWEAAWYNLQVLRDPDECNDSEAKTEKLLINNEVIIWRIKVNMEVANE